jgi:DNA repair photolyase
MENAVERNVTKGRGAPTNAVPTRFNLNNRVADSDWLDAREALDGGKPPLKTTVTEEFAKSILSFNNSPDVPFDRSVNAYRGCEHGCVYCFARPTHAYHDLSPGLDFESRLFAKPDAPALLRAALARLGHVPTPIAMGTNTDPYQPIEREWKITRGCIAVLADCGHPLTITTKSDRVVRDLDLLAPMAERGLVAVALSVTTLCADTHRRLEPRAPSPVRRLAAIRALAAAGVPVHVSVSPIIPAITDHELEAILDAAWDAGARTASYIPVRLPHEVAPLFRDWLAVHYPDRAAKVMAQVAALRGGRDNDPAFGSRMRGQGVWAQLIRTRFKIACKRLGFNEHRVELRQDLFEAPLGEGEGEQLRLI